MRTIALGANGGSMMETARTSPKLGRRVDCSVRGGLGRWGRLRCLAALVASASVSTLLAFAVASPATASHIGTRTALKPLDVTVQEFPSSDSSWLVYIAQGRGFFKKAGLNAKVVDVAQGAQAIAGLEAGSYNVSELDFTTAGVLIQKGVQLTMFAGDLYTHWSLVASASTSLPDLSKGYPSFMHDLAGKAIAVNGLGTSTYYFLEALLHGAGMSINDVKVVPTGGTPQELAAIESGQVAAAIEEPTSTYVLTHTVHARVLFNFGSPSPKLKSVAPALAQVTGIPWAGMWTTASWAKAHQRVVRRLQLAFMYADIWAHKPKNFSALVSLLKPNLPAIDPAIDPQIVKFALPYLETYFTEKAASAWSSFDARFGITSSKIPVSSWLSPLNVDSEAAVAQRVSSAS